MYFILKIFLKQEKNRIIFKTTMFAEQKYSNYNNNAFIMFGNTN